MRSSCPGFFVFTGQEGASGFSPDFTGRLLKMPGLMCHRQPGMGTFSLINWMFPHGDVSTSVSPTERLLGVSGFHYRPDTPLGPEFFINFAGQQGCLVLRKTWPGIPFQLSIEKEGLLDIPIKKVYGSSLFQVGKPKLSFPAIR